MKFSIVIPVYNEKDNLLILTNEITKALDTFYNYEIIFVDDFSNDNSIEVIQTLSNKDFIKLIKHKKNMGQSYAILSGIKASNNSLIVTLDADGQNNPKDIPKLLEKIKSDSNLSLVGGIRRKRKDNFIKILSSIIANKVRAGILNDNCPDTGCSLKIFKKQPFLSFPFFNGIHRFLPAFFKGYGYKTLFVDVDHRPRYSGKSKYGTIDRLFKGIYDLIRVRNILKKSNND